MNHSPGLVPELERETHDFTSRRIATNGQAPPDLHVGCDRSGPRSRPSRSALQRPPGGSDRSGQRHCSRWRDERDLPGRDDGGAEPSVLAHHRHRRGSTAYSILTVWTPSGFSRGSVSILPGGTGNGTVSSQPAGINSSLPSGAGACSASFPVGTIVRLTAKPGASTSFVAWRGVGCVDASKIVVARGSNITCQVGFVLK